jgi:nucleotide-binding universal stress UspA family protein
VIMHTEASAMFSRIVIGVDGRDSGRDAIVLAARLAPAGARMTAVHVAHEARDGSPVDAQPYEALLERELALAGIRADAVVIGHEHPGHGLRHAAHKLDADLLVLGASHRAGLGRVLRGRTARAALHDATCAVAIAARGAHRMWANDGTIGVGFDGSPGAQTALAAAAELARASGARLHVVAVGEPVDRLPAAAPDGRPWRSVDEQRAAASRAMVADAVDRVSATGVACTGEVVGGLTDDGLARLSEQVDLLVLGGCRYGPVGRLLVGSTADRLLDRARCAVLVVPRDAAHSDAAAAA